MTELPSAHPVFPWMPGPTPRPPARTTKKGIKKVRLLVKYEGIVRRLCSVSFTAGDSSLYIFPYSKSGHYRYGVAEWPNGEGDLQIDYSTGTPSDKTVKLSIHESGQIHIKVPGREDLDASTPVHIDRLDKLQGGHIATIHASHFGGLPEHRPKKLKADEDEHTTEAQRGVHAGRIAIYANASAPTFTGPCDMHFTLTRPTINKPLYVGLAKLGHEPHTTADDAVVITLAGLHPHRAPAPDDKVVYSVGLASPIPEAAGTA